MKLTDAIFLTLAILAILFALFIFTQGCDALPTQSDPQRLDGTSQKPHHHTFRQDTTHKVYDEYNK